MIDLEDLKLFLDLTQSRDKDVLLLSSIRQAISILEGLFNRELEMKERAEFTGLISEGSGLKGFFLSCCPVIGITSIKKYNFDSFEYDDLIAPEDIPGSVLLKENGEAVFLKRMLFHKAYPELKISYIGGFRNIKGTGTVSAASGTNLLIGTGTEFTEECLIGDEVKFSGIVRKVISIESRTSLILNDVIDSEITDASFRLSNVPEDIQQAIIYIAALNFLTSSHSRESLGLSSLSTDLRLIDDNNYNTIIDGNRNLIPQRYAFSKLDLTNLITKYKLSNT